MRRLLLQYKKPLSFLLKFVVIYIVLNMIYAVIIDHSYPSPDLITTIVTAHTSAVLNFLGETTNWTPSETGPYVYLTTSFHGNVLSVYEGCNAINVSIIFLAFLIALPFNKVLLWFIPLGILIIHVSNLARIVLLYFISLNFPDSLYFVHKYLFTAFLFAVIFALWYWYVKCYLVIKKE